MSGRIPARRIGHNALSSICRPTSYQHPPPPSLTPSRALSLSTIKDKLTGKNPNATPDLRNPVVEAALRKREAALKKPDTMPPPEPEPAKLGSTSIFQPEYEVPGWRDELPDEQKDAMKRRREEMQRRSQVKKDMELSALRLDPDPVGRKLLERKLVMDGVRRRGRLGKEARLKRTERELTFKSIQLGTSTKKLTKLMNMVQGKTVEEALVQLRFSKKKVARDVLRGLLLAQDQAMVERGMGIEGAQRRLAEADAARLLDGTDTTEMVTEVDAQKHKDEAKLTNEEKAERDALKAEEMSLVYPDGTRKLAPVTATEPTTITLKDGTRKQITDPSQIYIDQAWVGKADMWKSPLFRAKGQINIMRHRTSTFSVKLKEEKTRIRESEERQKKIDNRKLWTALPDRPITAQRQYCLW